MPAAETVGVLMAIVSSCPGGSAGAVTRYLVGNADPVTLASPRWGIGFLCVLPVALALHVRWPSRQDCPSVIALGFGGVRSLDTDTATDDAAPVAATMTVNPMTASLLAAALVGEPVTPNLGLGLVAVFAGIWIATTDRRVTVG